MSGWLLDTNIISAFGPGRPALAKDVVTWFGDRNDDLFLSTIVVAETDAGIAKLERTGAQRRAAELRTWFDGILGFYGDRVLAFDLAAARIAGELADAAAGIGRHPGFADIAVAAIAKARGLVVLTANARHFAPLGVEMLNPFLMH